jgi:hypothetical protein
MSGDELFVTLVAVVLGPAAWFIWLLQMATLQRLRRRASAAKVPSATLAVCAGLIVLVLTTLASFDIVDDRHRGSAAERTERLRDGVRHNLGCPSVPERVVDHTCWI